MTVWKFPLNPDPRGRCVVAMPSIRQPLSVGEQDGQLMLWAAVDPARPVEEVVHWVVPTGGEMPESAHYFRGTVQMANGLVFHVWQS